MPRSNGIDLDAIGKKLGLQAIAITGIRHSGKSSMLMMLAKKLSDEGKR